MDIKDVNEAIPIDLAEYAVANQIADGPEFDFWGTYTPKKRSIIICKVKTKYWRTTHNYGVRLTNNITEAIQINQSNGNIYWKDSLDKEMNKAKIAYKPRE